MLTSHHYTYVNESRTTVNSVANIHFLTVNAIIVFAETL